MEGIPFGLLVALNAIALIKIFIAFTILPETTYWKPKRCVMSHQLEMYDWPTLGHTAVSNAMPQAPTLKF